MLSCVDVMVCYGLFLCHIVLTSYAVTFAFILCSHFCNVLVLHFAIIVVIIYYCHYFLLSYFTVMYCCLVLLLYFVILSYCYISLLCLTVFLYGHRPMIIITLMLLLSHYCYSFVIIMTTIP